MTKVLVLVSRPGDQGLVLETLVTKVLVSRPGDQGLESFFQRS